LLAAIVVADHAEAHPGGGRDLTHRRALEAGLGIEGGRSLEDALLGLFRVGVDWTRHGPTRTAATLVLNRAFSHQPSAISRTYPGTCSDRRDQLTRDPIARSFENGVLFGLKAEG